MDIDRFIDELEKVCDCPNQGYIKCLEKVKELKAENEELKLDCLCLEAERDYVDPKGKYNYIDDYSDFNNHLKKKYNDDMYKKMYDMYKKMYEWVDEDEE